MKHIGHSLSHSCAIAFILHSSCLGISFTAGVEFGRRIELRYSFLSSIPR